MPYLSEQKGTEKQTEDLDYFFRLVADTDNSAWAISSKKGFQLPNPLLVY